jgi:RHS repeat-associated protein
MQLGSDAQIPDGLLAAMTLLNEKSHQGVPSWNLALHQGIDERNSTAAIGIRASAQLNRVWPRYTGKERDTESGLDYFGARYYGSNMGRFISPDRAAKPEAVPYSSLSDPQTLNLYSYMRNNPLGGADPDGHCGQGQSGSTGPNCQKLRINPVSQVSPATKIQIKNAVAATGKPSGADVKGRSHEEAGISYTVNGTQIQAPAQPGPYKDVTQPRPAQSDPYKAANPADAKPGDVQADVSYHTHPSATATTTTTNAAGQTVQTTSSFVQPPSAVDIQMASPSLTINFVVGTGNKTV